MLLRFSHPFPSLSLEFTRHDILTKDANADDIVEANAFQRLQLQSGPQIIIAIIAAAAAFARVATVEDGREVRNAVTRALVLGGLFTFALVALGLLGAAHETLYRILDRNVLELHPGVV